MGDFLAGGGELGGLLRGHDWSETPLGPPENWPQSLKMAVRIMLTSLQPIWIGWGKELIYLYNDPYKSIIGGKHPWALGKPTHEVWREIWPDIGPLLETAMGGDRGTYVESQLLIMERNGYPEETYYTFSYSPVPDDDGSVGGIICANSDDTLRVLSERQIALLRELSASTANARSWQDACQQSTDALATNARDVPFSMLYLAEPDSSTFVLAGSSGIEPGHPAAPVTLELANSAPWPIKTALSTHQAQVISGLDELFVDRLPAGAWDRPPFQAAILPILATGETGRSGILIVGLNPFRLFDENYRGFLGLVAGQIAAALANAQAYEEEKRRAEVLSELDRAKTTFFSNVSHEFRTPLTLMLGPIEELLAASEPADQSRPQLELAHRNGMRLLRLVNSLLDFSRIEAGRMRASFEPTDLSAFSAEIASAFRSVIEKAGLRFTVDCRKLSQPAYVDRDMWEKILLNLLSNAFKFTMAGGITVSVTESSDAAAALVRIADTGIGITPEEQPRLFERFHRVEGAQGRSFEGTGIGLALVQELARLHGASIEVESAVGQGTAFTIRVPFGHAHLAQDQISQSKSSDLPVKAHPYLEEALRLLPVAEAGLASSEPSRAALATDELPRESLPGFGKRVLLADDNADMRDYVRRLLETHGYAVETVEDGEAALSSARRSPPDLILTDVMMPKLDGFGVLRGIRSDPKLAGTPVLILSARAGEEAKVEALDAAADDYLAKPFAARELLARVNSNIQMAVVRRDAARSVMQSEQRFVMSQERLTLALSTGRVAIYDWDVESDRLSIQGPLGEVFGVALEDAASGLPLSSVVEGIHPDDREPVMALIARTVQTGEPFEAEYRVGGEGNPRTILSRGHISSGPSGQRMFSGALIDITEEKAAEQTLREQTRVLAILNKASSEIAGNLDLEQVVQTITEAGVELTGAAFGAFFYNVVDEAGERYTLYTLAGAPREAFSSFPMPRNTAVFGPTFAGEGIIRSDDILADPRYGKSAPYHGMPPGHLPVRSYLAVPVRSRTGDVLGGLFFGHSRPGIFDKRAEELMGGLAGQAAVAMDNATLFQSGQRELEFRRRAEARLHAINSTLEQRVQAEVAERVKAEEALRQAQKMEAIGQLTGGVAHDFNNLLTVIMGGLDTVRRSKPEDHTRIQRATEMALQGAQRAASLTARLLAFSRRQPLEPKPLELNALVREMTELLHRTLGETIELEAVMASRLWPIEADHNQLESAILNLAVNARDAMPEGGKLTIETANTALDESYFAKDTEVVPGQYVLLSVSDSGSGMSKQTVERAFEPFFTTKEVGRGTGLGLSMVYGFVKQSGGHVTLYSEQGHGTTVKLYFPRYRGKLDGVEAEQRLPAPMASREEVILVVEDNEDVRSYSVMILRELGYAVLEAADAEKALRILEGTDRVDLLFTDVVLPGKNGRLLADSARLLRPDLRILFTTGYSRNAIVHQGRLDADVHLISKPFTFDQLAARIRDVIDLPTPK
jgi:signal transduction histidine kinase/DNA-binding response OmpR family regulator